MLIVLNFRLKKDALSNEPVKSNARSFKARPLNRKVGACNE